MEIDKRSKLLVRLAVVIDESKLYDFMRECEVKEEFKCIRTRKSEQKANEKRFQSGNKNDGIHSNKLSWQSHLGERSTETAFQKKKKRGRNGPTKIVKKGKSQ